MALILLASMGAMWSLANSGSATNCMLILLET